MRTAPAICQEICVEFLASVVLDHVFSESELFRGSGPLDGTRRQQVEAGQRIDQRLPLLLRISGKGGWSPDGDRRATFAAFTNVTLLDHLLSVTRGALDFGAIDLLRGEIEPRRSYAAASRPWP